MRGERRRGGEGGEPSGEGPEKGAVKRQVSDKKRMFEQTSEV